MAAQQRLQGARFVFCAAQFDSSNERTKCLMCMGICICVQHTTSPPRPAPHSGHMGVPVHKLMLSVVHVSLTCSCCWVTSWTCLSAAAAAPSVAPQQQARLWLLTCCSWPQASPPTAASWQSSCLMHWTSKDVSRWGGALAILAWEGLLRLYFAVWVFRQSDSMHLSRMIGA
jgi:hypothetical protein